MPTQSPAAETQRDPQTYAEKFQCLGSTCEDTCCGGWTVPLEQAIYDRYQALPPSPLKVLLNQSMERNTPCGSASNGNTAAHGDGVSKAIFAKIRMNEANQCPLLTTDHLCRVQQELGAEMLSHTCPPYPRIVHSVGGVREAALTLSCPEAARLVLLSPDLTSSALVGSRPSTDSISAAAPASTDSLPPYFWAIRGTVLRLVRMRAYPLWQRMFLLDLLCRRLDMIGSGELATGVPEFLTDFEAAAATTSLRANLETLPADRNAQLDVVLRLAGLMLKKSSLRPRFVAAVKAFTTGIGNGPGATLESLSAKYAQAYEQTFRPFTERNPHVMENFLINTIVRCQFPFSADALKPGAAASAKQTTRAHEFALLAAQFALMRGLLIGVAGFHGPAFSEGHVVETVQAASKHFEHHPEFLTMAHALLVERGADGARGMAILLRDARMEGAEVQVANAPEVRSEDMRVQEVRPMFGQALPTRADAGAGESTAAIPAIHAPARQAERSA